MWEQQEPYNDLTCSCISIEYTFPSANMEGPSLRRPGRTQKAMLPLLRLHHLVISSRGSPFVSFLSKHPIRVVFSRHAFQHLPFCTGTVVRCIFRVHCPTPCFRHRSPRPRQALQPSTQSTRILPLCQQQYSARRRQLSKQHYYIQGCFLRSYSSWLFAGLWEFEGC